MDASKCRRCEEESHHLRLSPDGLCLTCSLIERLASDSEPLLSHDRDTRDTDRCPPPERCHAPLR
jgi:hypothetical protein